MRSTALMIALSVGTASSVASAQTSATRTEETRVPRPTVTFHRAGHHDVLTRVLEPGVTVIETTEVDVDGDGDRDALLTVEGSPAPSGKRVDGRGVMIVYRERLGWRGVTVASTRGIANPEGYQWGLTERLQGTPMPLLHLRFSHAGPDGSWESDTLLLHERGKGLKALHAVEARAPSFRESYRVEVFARMEPRVNNDGATELVERVSAAEVVDEDGVVHPDAVPHTVRERRLRWDAARQLIVAVEDHAAQRATH